MEGYRSRCEVRQGICYKIAKNNRELDFNRKDYEYKILDWLQLYPDLFDQDFFPILHSQVVPTIDLPQIAYEFIQGKSNIYNRITDRTVEAIAKDLSVLHSLDLRQAPKILRRQSQLSAFELFDNETKPSSISGNSSIQTIFEGYKAKLLSSIRNQDLSNTDKCYFLHGDLKPQNLILKPNDKLSIIDFEDSYISDGVELELSLLFGNCKWSKRMVITFLKAYQILVNIELLNQYFLIKMFSKISGDISLKYSETSMLTCEALEKEFEDWNILLENPITKAL